MGFASYTENILEKLVESQNNFQSEIRLFRTTLADTKFTDRKIIEEDVVAFKRRLTRFLDELDRRSMKIFDEAIKRLKDPGFNIVARMNKKEGQLETARKQRNDAFRDRQQTRNANIKLVAERDEAIEECERLRKQNAELLRAKATLEHQLSNIRDWKAEMKGVKRL